MNENSSSFACLFIMLLYLAPAPAHAQHPFIKWPEIDAASSEFPRFRTFVDQALAGRPGYAFSAADAMVMYRTSGESRYADHAISMVDSFVTSEEQLISSGQRASIAADSYLYVGPHVRDIALTYDWAFDRLSSSQKSRWSAYLEQAVWNVWHPSDARWGATPFPWSGWSTNNPGNNYFYSFIEATMLWALAGQQQTWLDLLNQQKLPQLVAYFQTLPGGGSREGTGYGSSHRLLFWLYLIWKESTGADLSGQSPHAKETVDYWVHATVPTLQRFAPLGDQARDSTAAIYDYQRSLVLAGAALNPGTSQARHGRWWLQHISLSQMSSGFNLRDGLVRLNDPAQQPRALAYYSSGTGHLFARSSWNTNASWFSFVAGPYIESHDHHHQGAFSLYKDAWLAVTENIFSHSGIHQEPEVHNVVRFAGPAGTILQSYGSTSSLTFTDEAGTLTVNADLTPAFAGRSAQVRSWERRAAYNGRTLRVEDTFSTGSGVQAIWQINTPAAPQVQGGIIKAGGLTIRPIAPVLANLQVQIVDWRSVDAAQYPNGGFKVELRGSNEGYLVELEIDGAEPRGGLPPAAPGSLRLLGR